MLLTETEVRDALPGKAPYKLWDGGGLYLAVQTSGSKIWRLKCHVGRQERVIGFGRYPAVSLAEARVRRSDALHALAQGRDLLTDTRINPAPSLRFEAVARNWHKSRARSLSPFYANRLLARLELDMFPAFGERIITRITPFEVLTALRKIEDRGALTVALQMKRAVGQICRYAIAHGWMESDPTANLHDALRRRPRPRHQPRVGFTEFPDFLRAVCGSGDASDWKCREVTRDALIFTLLTWARTSETRGATWSEFEDLEGTNPLWRIPAERMKAHREHLVPLSRQAVQLLLSLRKQSSTSHIFLGRDGVQPMSQASMISTCYRLGFRRRQSVHGLRRVASTWANEALRYSPDCIEMALSHHVEDTRGVYNSALYLGPRRVMLQHWADVLVTMGLCHSNLPVPAETADQPGKHGLSGLSHFISIAGPPVSHWASWKMSTP
ncbi:MAG TPA: integrase arm-type DNA-binding domain-containing protein [Sphingobium sp.]